MQNYIPRAALLRLAIIGALCITASSKALALEQGYCDTPAAVSAALKNEGHKSLASMDQPYIHDETKDERFAALFITANEDFSEWYQLQADQPLGEPAEEFCIKIKGRDLFIRDIRKPNPPALPERGFDEEHAKQMCRDIRKEIDENFLCDSYKSVLNKMAVNRGMFPVMQGHVMTDKGEVLITIVAKLDEGKNFRFLSSEKNGITSPLITGRRFNFLN